MTCIFYCSQILKAKEIWIVGLDFYATNYIGRSGIKKDSFNHGEKMMKRFVKYMELFSFIEYKMVTYKKQIPKFDNLNII